MRPASPYRRQPAIALLFAAWCAVYGLPTEFARNLTAQTADPSARSASKPALQAKVLLVRLSTQVRRAEQSRFPFLGPDLAPVAASPLAACQILFDPSAKPAAVSRTVPALYQRPPPSAFPS